MSYPDFKSDYMEGAHPTVLERLMLTNSEKTSGYGTDPYTASAAEKIKKACDSPDARVYFLVGGTQTNKTVLASILAPYQGVVSADTGHIATHESGAVESSGHKVITVPTHEGRIDPDELDSVFKAYMDDSSREHTVMPGAVYVSHPTEYGTLYSKKQLMQISEVCKKWGAPLFLDGARMGYGLMAEGADLTLSDIAALTDIFYIGGTKVGALFGEALVITAPDLCPCFVSMIKQQGCLLAKGRMLGIQFDTLFTDDLYFRISKNAIDTAMYMKKGLLEKGYSLYLDSPTNQQFIIVKDSKLEQLKEKVGYTYWERLDSERSVIRLVTSFMTTKEQVDELLSLM